MRIEEINSEMVFRITCESGDVYDAQIKPSEFLVRGIYIAAKENYSKPVECLFDGNTMFGASPTACRICRTIWRILSGQSVIGLLPYTDENRNINYIKGVEL